MPGQPHGSFDQTDLPPHARQSPPRRAPGLTGELLPEPLPDDPFPILRAWYDQALARRDTPNPNAMTLATVDGAGRPAARIVLCKALEPDPGAVVFYTNYQGRKGHDLGAHPEAALVFHWDALDRQARIEGPVTRTSEEESDAYFASRPWESRVGAWSSDQSRPVASRRELLEKVRATMQRFGIDPDHPERAGPAAHIPRPPHWGGYRVLARRVELWVSGTGRVHDRAEWTRELTPAAPPGPWAATRLQP
jgi:pyridoxamine 5'-phosphate oxidase